MPLVQTRGAASAQGFGEFAQAAAVVNYIEDVFSTYLYTGNGTSQTITNGIDLSTKGGLVWIKNRNQTNFSHRLIDTVRGGANYLESNNSDPQGNYSGNITAFSSSGFSLGDANFVNSASNTFASWTFREQPKFFDVVTYTGDGNNSRMVSHNLGSVPGCIIVKRTDSTSNWFTWHIASGITTSVTGFQLNTTAAATTTGYDVSTDITSTQFRAAAIFDSSSNDPNVNGGTYVAYLFAHNAGGFGLTGTDNVISCGSFTTDGSGNATVSLGYEPQWALVKRTDAAGTWWMMDTMRGWTASTGNNFQYLQAQSSSAEGAAGTVPVNATGFTVAGNNFSASATYIYIAIRRGPMKVPTLGTSVYESTTYTGNNTAERKIGSSVLTDLLLLSNRDATATDWSTYAQFVFDRLRGQNLSLSTSNTNAQVSGWNNYCNFDMNTGWDTGSTADQQYLNKTSATYVSNVFSRAPGFFDVVCYTGSSSATTVTHNLAVAPELIICKNRTNNNGNQNWQVYSSALGATSRLQLNTTDSVFTGTSIWNSTSPTASVFSLGTSALVNGSGDTYVAYLFATCPGVSKIGSYTGNGTTQTINCGFTGGARFVLIKRTDASGDWYTYDTARGMTVLTDPYLLLNSTAAEVATLGSVTTVSTGFALNSAILAAINVNAGTYIFLAIS